MFVGYSLPEYDHQVLELLKSSSRHSPRIHVFDRDPSVPQRYKNLLGTEVVPHPGIPEALKELEETLAAEGHSMP